MSDTERPVAPLPHLRSVHRASERDLRDAGIVGLDRNERAEPFDASQYADILASLTVEDLIAYPDTGPFVDLVAGALRIPADHITPTPGSDGAIRRAMQAFLAPGDRVLLVEPTYAMYRVYADIFQAGIVSVPYATDLSFPVAEVLDRLTPDIRMLAMTSPGQPTGTVIAPEDLQSVLARARAADVVCVLDEAYARFHSETATRLVRDYENLVIARSFSKAPGLPGLRLGYAVAQPSLLHGIDAVRGNSEVSAPALAIGRYFLERPQLEAAYVDRIEAGRKVLLAAAEALGFATPPCPTNFQLIRVTPGLDPVAVAAALEQSGFLVKAGYDHPGLLGCLRVSLAGPEIMCQFAEALTRVSIGRDSALMPSGAQ